MLINIIASGLPIALLNLLIYPLIADKVGATVYGTMTTCVGLQNLVNGVWGSTIAYTRLLNKDGEDTRGFPLLFLASAACGLRMHEGRPESPFAAALAASADRK